MKGVEMWGKKVTIFGHASMTVSCSKKRGGCAIRNKRFICDKIVFEYVEVVLN